MFSTTRNRNPSRLLAATLAVGGVFLAASASHAETFSITLTNLTNSAPNSGQTFSPAVFATHSDLLSLWTGGEAVSPELDLIAQEGENSALVGFLTTLQNEPEGIVSSIATPNTAPLMPGQSLTFTITTDVSRPFLSSAWMLGRTNDGFAGNNAINLFNIIGSADFDLVGLDAGSEVNNESALFLPAFGGTLSDPENGVIGLHSGIRGDADAPASWNFSGAVARVSVTVVPEASSVMLFATAGLLGALTLARRSRRA